LNLLLSIMKTPRSFWDRFALSSVSEPFLSLDQVGLHEVLIGLGEVDDAFDQTDHPTDPTHENGDQDAKQLTGISTYLARLEYPGGF
jgi:hypothetical protein